MPRPTTLPDTVEECRTISISDLKKWDYLTGSGSSGTLSWSRHGETVASIGISSYPHLEEPLVLIYYTITSRSTGEKKDYKIKIPLEKVPSNLGKGYRFYFICPYTGKRCMKLYQAPNGNVFAHRTYWNLMYDNQTKSKRWRQVGRYFDLNNRLDSIETRYMKNFYRGKPTPRFIAQWKLMKKLKGMGEVALRELYK